MTKREIREELARDITWKRRKELLSILHALDMDKKKDEEFLTTMNDTGGGIRIIRSAKGLS